MILQFLVHIGAIVNGVINAFIKNSYCCGEAGKRAVNKADEHSKGLSHKEDDKEETEEQEHEEK